MSEEKADYEAELQCPHCQSTNLKLGGFTPNTRKQVVHCKSCRVDASYSPDLPSVIAFREKQAARFNRDHRDPTTGRFLIGSPGGPGRSPGARAKFEEKLFKLVTQMVEKNGETFISLAGRPETFNDVMTFIRVASKLVSKQMQVETSSQTDELLALLASQPTNSPITRLKNSEPSVTE